MKIISILKYIFLLNGIAMLGVAFFFYSNTSSFLKQTAKAEGTVVELVQQSKSYSPVVHFTTPKGETIEYVSSISSSPPRYTKGQKVEVFYKPEAPKNAMINDFFSLWGFATIFSSVGSVFLIAGVVFFVLSMKGNRTNS